MPPTVDCFGFRLLGKSRVSCTECDYSFTSWTALSLGVKLYFFHRHSQRRHPEELRVRPMNDLWTGEWATAGGDEAP